ncbi:LORF1 protein, partial [Crocuta crocuta]
IKNAVNEVQNKLEAVTASTEEAEGRIGEIEDKILGKDEAEKEREKRNSGPQGRIRELSDSMKWSNSHIIGVLEEEEKEKGVEDALEQIIAENFRNLGKETDTEIPGAKRTSFRRNLN